MEAAVRVDQYLRVRRLKRRVDSKVAARPSVLLTGPPCSRVVRSQFQACSLPVCPGRPSARFCCRAQSSQTEEATPRQAVEGKRPSRSAIGDREQPQNGPTSGAARSSSNLPTPNLDCVANGMAVECVLHTDLPTQTLEGARSQTAGNGSLLSPDGFGQEDADLDCVATGISVECISAEELKRLDTLAAVQAAASGTNGGLMASGGEGESESSDWTSAVLDTLLLISPFFFWGSAMVAMKDVLPRAGPMFVASFRLLPAGLLLLAFASSRGRPQPKSATAWLAITLFALVDATAFQGCLAEGLKRTPAGLGSVIIDSQPLTVAILATLLFGESLSLIGVSGLVLGVVGLLLLEVPPDRLLSLIQSSAEGLSVLSSPATSAALTTSGLASSVEAAGELDLWQSGEWWMLLAAQSMAIGTVMVRWVCKHADPIMATGWHMIIGSIPLIFLAFQQQDPAVSGHLSELSTRDWSALLYTSVFGSAVSYGVFFYNANKGNLTRLSSLTFLTPAFAAMFGYFLLDETLTPLQLGGAMVTIIAIYLVNYRPSSQ